MNGLINILLIDDNPENYALTVEEAFRQGAITKQYNIAPKGAKIPALFFDDDNKRNTINLSICNALN